jgi:hypothetical protein
MKTTLLPLAVAALFGQAALAGPAPVSPAVSYSPEADAFANVRRPMTNPTLFDLALPTTNIHPIFLHHRLPKNIDLAGGGQVPVGGDVQLYALQFEIALNDRLSIVATKDGYVDFNPDNTLSSTNGFANLGGGLKYAFIRDEAAGVVVSGTATFEVPTGNSDVLQGEGKGLTNLILNGLKMHDAWQFAGSVGLQIPFSGQQSTSSFVSTHVSYELCSWFIPLVELNWFHVWDAGDGTGNFNGQLGGAVPGAVAFEGGDLFNLGAVNAGQNRDLVTAAIGFRSRLTDSVQVGVAYEMPLTDDSASVMRDRLTLDLVWRF